MCQFKNFLEQRSGSYISAKCSSSLGDVAHLGAVAHLGVAAHRGVVAHRADVAHMI